MHPSLSSARRCGTLAALTVFLSTDAVAQGLWREIPSGEIGTPAAAYDQAHSQVVVLGQIGGDLGTQLWDGSRWVRAPLALRPGRGPIAYDAARQRTVLVTDQTATYEWDGLQWNQRFPTVPAGRVTSLASMVYDSARQRVVLVGALNTCPSCAATYEFNGTDWSRPATVNHPSNRADHALAYDSQRARTVLFGGNPGAGPVADTWEFDGSQWLQRAPAHSPAAREEHVMAFDAVRGRTVLFGGRIAGTPLNDTWEWDGTDWAPAFPITSPTPRQGMGMVFDSDRGHIVLVGGTGTSSPQYTGEVWEYDGSNWTRRHHSAHPGARTNTAAAVAPTRGRGVLFGGRALGSFAELADTWELEGSEWIARSPALRPEPRADHALAWDGSQVLLVAGADAWGMFADTWTWDGTLWTRTPASPGARRSHAVSDGDGGSHRPLLFGGVGLNGYLGDTREWTGGGWSLRATPTAPAARQAHTMAFDPVRGRVVLFGGLAPAGPLDDTWEWDGAAWTQLAPAARPPARFLHASAFDPTRGRVVVSGGLGLDLRALGDLWEWDGTRWSLVSVPAAPPARSGHVLLGNAAWARMVLFGGAGPAARGDDTWELVATQPATYATYGRGCPGSNGIPTLAPVTGSLPRIGQTFSLRLASLPPGRPVFALLGASRSSWQGLPLPLDLTPIGMTGCSLLASGDLITYLASLGSTVQWDLPLCNCPELVDATFVNQALILDPLWNLFGMVASNGGEGRIGR